MSHGSDATGEGDGEGVAAALAEVAGDELATPLVLPQAVSNRIDASSGVGRTPGAL
jgi:hypothetical protein